MAQARALPPASLIFSRKTLGRLLGIAAIVTILVGSPNFSWIIGQPWEFPLRGLTFVAVGAVLLAAAIWLLRPKHDLFSVTHSPAIISRVRWLPVIIGTTALAIMMEADANYLLPDFHLNYHVQFILFAGGIALAGYGLGAFTGFRRADFIKWGVLPLALITLFAFLLRIWYVSESAHMMIDELHFYDGVLHFWINPSTSVLSYLDGIAAFPHLFSYFQAWSAALFGVDFGSMRLPSVIFGTLTVPAVYLLGRALSDHKTGLLAAFMLAVFPPHIHFSRLALNNIADPLFGTLAIAFLVSALRSNRQRDYVLAGMCIGFTSYFYEGGRLLFAGLFIFSILLIWIVGRPREHRRGLLLMGLMALLVLMPFYYTAHHNSPDFAPRLTSQGTVGYLLRDLKLMPVWEVAASHWNLAVAPTITHLLYAPDGSRFYYGGYTGLILWFVVPFYMLGLCYALFRWRTSGLLLVAWNVFTLLGVSLSTPCDWSVRYCAIFPAVALTIAVGLRYPLEAVTRGIVKRRTLFIGIAILATVLGLFQLRYYYGDHLRQFNQQLRTSFYDFYDAFDRAAQIESVRQIIYVDDHNGVYDPVLDTSIPLRGLDMTYAVWKPENGFSALLANLPRDQVIAFAITPADTTSFDRINRVFPLSPALPWSSIASVPLDRQYVLYLYIPPR